ncbi:MAG: hypothetical protein ACREL1_03550 [bacterium]
MKNQNGWGAGIGLGMLVITVFLPLAIWADNIVSASPTATPIPFAFGTPTPGVTPTPTCAALGASADSQAKRNYIVWCAPSVAGVLFEQDDANNGVSYLVFNGTETPVDVRLGSIHLVNMDSDLNDGWIRVLPRKEADLGHLTAYDANQPWSGGVTTTVQVAKQIF